MPGRAGGRGRGSAWRRCRRGRPARRTGRLPQARRELEDLAGYAGNLGLDVELTERHKELRLVVTEAGDGINADHTDWVDAGFGTK